MLRATVVAAVIVVVSTHTIYSKLADVFLSVHTHTLFFSLSSSVNTFAIMTISNKKNQQQKPTNERMKGKQTVTLIG